MDASSTRHFQDGEISNGDPLQSHILNTMHHGLLGLNQDTIGQVFGKDIQASLAKSQLSETFW